ncbi:MULTISPECIES: LacI family DNA-binding transcriptional regulator [Rhizobium/Agrobacterium group]|uniref:LacI family transcriptional regulator n=3 Tax=Agrobacterium tumefaciens TaxID=358 RepID=A0A2L2LLQ4_AGRTU|nr:MULTISPECIES: LacI family DNA-binding transcriptional regulator [Rhizobium/Agrobacterium group]AHK05217.1 LacI family transcriptional regulator [Agrobacterium tumefaciens LBA4213 (Ach5)]AKC10946.1 LacI family transcriptional regulator [Agrobacterium tumefaciens]AVH45260.1 LacI family transcriptional regulator [Agrobacterium tumefaciens]AYM20419.1 LacI family transcriptional regulator [Agrobacterium tumefaciens]AYM71719.1 LacI family transcriptional regulator [Agrobacterium tumefaciens]
MKDDKERQDGLAGLDSASAYEQPVRDASRSGIVPTIADVARAAGVSRATAARVLGDYGYVKEQTREVVLNAAKEMAYQPNQLARSMATGRSKTIGVIVADIENLYFARAIRAITDTASAHGFMVILATSDEDIALERDAVRVLLAKRVDGLIISPTSSSEVDHLISASERDCPVVLLDRRVPVLRADTFAVDNFGAAYEAVKSLIGQGHRNVALVSNAPDHGEQRHLISSVRERVDGYRAALHDTEIPVSSDFIVFGGWDPQRLALHVRALCMSANRPTAFLATDSSVALVLLAVLKDMNLSIPDEVSLICFDDPDWTAATTPALTVISQPIRDLAAAATEHLIARLKGEASGPGSEMLLPATLISRASVSVAPQPQIYAPKGRKIWT